MQDLDYVKQDDAIDSYLNLEFHTYNRRCKIFKFINILCIFKFTTNLTKLLTLKWNS